MLLFIHSIFTREHNRVAKLIRETKGASWTDEVLFQEARRIVIAEYQHIVYTEWLQTFISFDQRLFNPRPRTDGLIANEFIHAAFRYLHQLTPESVKFFNAGRYDSLFLLIFSF